MQDQAASHDLWREVIAEGVETEAQLSELKRMRGRHMQGYVTGRPQPAIAIRALIASS
jgi:EAL domain-containing protein (putative c-di-GMP-specific phosphodiesterase class I)